MNHTISEETAMMKKVLNYELNRLRTLDYYKLNMFKPDCFSCILDLGAHIGSFSLYARELFPNADIIAFEGVQEPNLRYLIKFTSGHNIYIVHKIIGDGSFLSLSKRRGTTDTFLFEKSTNQEEPLYKSERLHNVVRPYITGRPIYMKCNIEGSERFFVGDKDVENMLIGFNAFTIQIHFTPKKIEKAFSHGWLPFTAYSDWFNDLYSKDFFISYHTSRRSSGVGHYTLLRKDSAYLLKANAN